VPHSREEHPSPASSSWGLLRWTYSNNYYKFFIAEFWRWGLPRGVKSVAVSNVLLDKEAFVRNRCVFAVLVVSLLLGISPLAADPVIQRGIDAFNTPASGRTFYDFAHKPIPAGFFCERSEPFTGRVELKGMSLATGAPGQLRGADTVIERLNNAAFDANGTAVTRIVFRALSMVSIAPIQTACGSFHVYISLAGRQRVTKMTIYRTQEGGGIFEAPLKVNARLTFIPVKPTDNEVSRKLEILGAVNFPGNPLPWSFPVAALDQRRREPVFVDTNGDLRPDTLLPSVSNFLPGISPDRIMLKSCQCIEGCHMSSGEMHCYTQIPPQCYTCSMS
jgi:hypothetical protein